MIPRFEGAVEVKLIDEERNLWQLLADLGHILEMSGTGAVVELSRLPLSEPYREEVRRFSLDPYAAAVAGGEDYELCFASSPANHEIISEIMKKCGVRATPVGIVTTSREVKVLDLSGSPYFSRLIPCPSK